MGRPPLGIMPRYIWLEHRVHEIQEGINRFMEAGKPMPPEWADELVWLMNELYQIATKKANSQ
jgi:hypothetical protein